MQNNLPSNENPPEPRTRIRWVVGILGIVIVGGLVVSQAYKRLTVRPGKVSGTIHAIDVQARTASIEVTISNGKKIILAGSIAPECQILADGGTARFEDLKNGDYVKIEGEILWGGKMIANRINVIRDELKIPREHTQPIQPNIRGTP